MKQQKDYSLHLLALVLAIAILVSSCTNYYSPYKAANTGGKKCNKRTSIR